MSTSGSNLLQAAYQPIEDYAVIGDCRSAALLSRQGSIDWLCWPLFHSPSIFAALLDPERGGYFSIRPSEPFRTERRYIPDTNALETVFHTSRGSVALRDVMVVPPPGEARHTLAASHEILRIVVGLTGETDMDIQYVPRPGYAERIARLDHRGALGIRCDAGRGILTLRSEAALQISPDGGMAHGMVTVRAGEQLVLSLIYNDEGPAVMPALGPPAHERWAQSLAWWRAWSDRCTYRGPYRDAVRRSALTLKLMCYSPSGAVVAAPTTSLPEVIGGDRNWDYRYCWLRDAALTVHALKSLGYGDDAAAYSGWLLHATRLSWPELQIMYNVFGETDLEERTLPHLAGYGMSRPVRMGNEAHAQRQLDVYGEVVDAVVRSADTRAFFDRDTVRFLNGLGQTVCEQWRYPDAGIWESRETPRHYTHSKVLCWAALDRLVSLHERYGLRLDAERFAHERDAIRSTVEARGYNEHLGSYTQTLDGDTVDASLLTLPWYRYLDGRHPRIVSSVLRIAEQLSYGPLTFRYREPTNDGLPAREGAFGICSFWMVEALARSGRGREAGARFKALLDYANDVGLYGEEVDPRTGAALGNYPQAFTHVGLINAALSLTEASDGITEEAL